MRIPDITINGIKVNARTLAEFIQGDGTFQVIVHLTSGQICGLIKSLDLNQGFITLRSSKYGVVKVSDMTRELRLESPINFSNIERIEVLTFMFGDYTFYPIDGNNTRGIQPLLLNWIDLFRFLQIVRQAELGNGFQATIRNANSLIMDNWKIELGHTEWVFRDRLTSKTYDQNPFGVKYFTIPIDGNNSIIMAYA